MLLTEPHFISGADCGGICGVSADFRKQIAEAENFQLVACDLPPLQTLPVARVDFGVAGEKRLGDGNTRREKCFFQCVVLRSAKVKQCVVQIEKQIADHARSSFAARLPWQTK